MPKPNIVDYLNFSLVSGSCGYYKNRLCTELFVTTNWLEQIPDLKIDTVRLYSDFKEKGFCRFNNSFYTYKCYGCNECKAIRIPVKDFSPSKSQRVALRKNSDLEITIEKDPENFVTDEKIFLFREYDFFHNKADGEVKKSNKEAAELLGYMNSGYKGIWNMEYRLNGRLIGVAILDYTVDDDSKINSIASNYFYYDVDDDIRKRSLGVFSVLKEIELCRSLNVEYYYLGLFLDNCKKMNYKSNYKPCELFIEDHWFPEEVYTRALRGSQENEYAPLEGVAEKTEGLCSEGKAQTSEAQSSPLKLIKFPPAGTFYPDYPDISFITEDIWDNYLYSAYMQGIFPWFNEDEGEPVIWQSPDPRFVIFPDQLHVSKSIKKFLNHTPYTYSMDRCFDEVMKQCGLMNREGQNGTWIGPKMLKAYSKFHKDGYAHSIEVWNGDKLVGGFYGILMGEYFCGESMFTIEPNSSKSAFVLFAKSFFEAGGKLIDCQAYTDNMARYGAVEIPREEFLKVKENIFENNTDLDMKTIFYRKLDSLGIKHL